MGGASKLGLENQMWGLGCREEGPEEDSFIRGCGKETGGRSGLHVNHFPPTAYWTHEPLPAPYLHPTWELSKVGDVAPFYR